MLAGQVALMLAAAFAGAAFYVSLAEHPARLALDDKSLLKQLQDLLKATTPYLKPITPHVHWHPYYFTQHSHNSTADLPIGLPVVVNRALERRRRGCPRAARLYRSPLSPHGADVGSTVYHRADRSRPNDTGGV